LDLTQNVILDGGVANLVEAFSNPQTNQLIKLTLAHCRLSGTSMTYLIQLAIDNHHLQYLDLTGNQFGTFATKQFSPKINQTSLISLVLNNNLIDNSCFKYLIINIGSYTKLKELSLLGNHYSSQMEEELRKAAKGSSVSSLRLGSAFV
jgi:hypothetical protein